jgi:hypothetical protein
MTPPNNALQRTRPSRCGCNPRVPRAGSLSLGRQMNDASIQLTVFLFHLETCGEFVVAVASIAFLLVGFYSHQIVGLPARPTRALGGRRSSCSR